MGASLPGDDDDGQGISDINVTPFVDVVLVLLVIFMVAAPIMARSNLKIELPKSSTTDAKVPRTLGIAITRLGQILLEGQPATPEAVQAKVREVLAAHPDVQAVLSADKESRHEDLVKAIDLIKSAGLERFALEVRRERSP